MATAPETKPEPEVKLRAVHGRIEHPGTNTWFDTDTERKHVVDNWVKMQIEYGKLEVVKPE